MEGHHDRNAILSIDCFKRFTVRSWTVMAHGPVLSAATRPAIWRISVDLPEPDAPIKATISPGLTLRLTSSRPRMPFANVLLRPSMRIAVNGFSLIRCR
jgi:hypothetical protein